MLQTGVISLSNGSSKSIWKPQRRMRLDLVLLKMHANTNLNLNPLPKLRSSSSDLLHKKVSASVKNSLHLVCAPCFLHLFFCIVPPTKDVSRSSIWCSFEWSLTYQLNTFHNSHFASGRSSLQLTSKYDQVWKICQVLMKLMILKTGSSFAAGTVQSKITNCLKIIPWLSIHRILV